MTTDKPIEPTMKEAFFMLHVLNNQEGTPKVKWDAVAQAVGLKSANVASVRFGQIKKRLGWGGPKGANGTATQSTISPAKVTKRANGAKSGNAKATNAKARAAAAAADAMEEAGNQADNDAVEVHGGREFKAKGTKDYGEGLMELKQEMNAQDETEEDTKTHDDDEDGSESAWAPDDEA